MKIRSLPVVGLCFLFMGLSWEVGAFSEKDFQKLKTTNQCKRCNLIGANLIKAELTRANLREATLAWATLTDSLLARAK